MKNPVTQTRRANRGNGNFPRARKLTSKAAAITCAVAAIATPITGSVFSPAAAAPQPTPTASAPAAQTYNGPQIIPIPKNKYTQGTGYGVPGPLWKWKGYHTGVDFGASEGTPIIASGNGTITAAEWGGAYGNMVIQRLDPHTELLYAHMTHSTVKPGDTVKAGQVIGYVGATGNTTGPHLHFEYRIDGEPVDPQPWLNGSTPTTATIPSFGDPAASSLLQTQTEAATTELATQLANLNDAETAVQNAREKLVTATARVSATTKAESTMVENAENAELAVDNFARQAYMQGAASDLSKDVNLVLQGPDGVRQDTLAEQTLEGQSSANVNNAETVNNMVATLHAETEASIDAYQSAQKELAEAETAHAAAVEQYNTAADAYKTASLTTTSGTVAPMGVQTKVDSKGCPVNIDVQWVRDGLTPAQAHSICRKAVDGAPTPEAAKAIIYTFQNLGAPYACGGAGRLDPYRFDCSSLVARAYNEGAGLTKIPTWATTVTFTRPVPEYLAPVSTTNIRPGDLVFYAQPGTDGSGASGHVVMALGDGYMIDTGSCGDGVRVQQLELSPSWTAMEGVMRVNPSKAR